MVLFQIIELQPSHGQELDFLCAAAARAAHNDLIALWREDGKRLKAFRFRPGEFRPRISRVRYTARPRFRELSQNTIKGGLLTGWTPLRSVYIQNRKTSDLGPGELLHHDCGYRRGRLGLETRRWRCPEFGRLHDRDVTTTLNVRDYGPLATRFRLVDTCVRPAYGCDSG